MVRVKRGFKARRRRNRVLRLASGYYGARSRLFKTAKETVDRALAFAYRDRRTKKREFRRLWISRINASARTNNLSYSVLMANLKKSNIKINRKLLAVIAFSDANGFSEIVKSSLWGADDELQQS